ncbi:hypothetical protein G7Z17_g4885 [Cylindrodendrum hubeiense]|uniref:Dephospho-CoA kinase n=1 Tax=Cylindrodendrum hubeiense TaxID=595255 RepID=A0A9P5H7Y1_9HYPO|nr:hypothetical protein G7Z17_g4885 [Cylindrodendrum hubeiense]
MLLIGLTGSIATGKSTVSSMLASGPYNLPVVDADVIARQVVEPGTKGYNAIVRYFGPTTPDLLVDASENMPENGPSGTGRPLNRPALGRRIFGDSEERKKDRQALNGIVHPARAGQVLRRVGGGGRARPGDPDAAVARARPHLSAEDAENRVRSQTDVREKARRAEERGKGKGAVLWNDGTREELGEQLKGALGEMRQEHPDWWAWTLVACPPLAVAVVAWRYYQNIQINKQWEARSGELKGKL